MKDEWINETNGLWLTPCLHLPLITFMLHYIHCRSGPVRLLRHYSFRAHFINSRSSFHFLHFIQFISFSASLTLNNGARWIFTSFSLVIMALMLGNRFENSHYASYECGLFQKTVARVKYEITFYTVALTFLIFEYELLFIFPLLLSLQVSHKSF